MTEEQMHDFLEENITLIIPNALYQIIVSSISNFIDEVGADNLKGVNFNEMLMPVFENELQKKQWQSKMLQTEILFKQILEDILKKAFRKKQE